MHRGPASLSVDFVESSDPLSAEAMTQKLLGMVRAGTFVADSEGFYTKRQSVKSENDYSFSSKKTNVASEVLYAVRSQATPHEAALATELKDSLVAAGAPLANIVSLHDEQWKEDRFSRGYWTLLPWLKAIAMKNAGAAGDGGMKWVLLLEPSSRVDLPQLQQLLDGRWEHSGKPLSPTDPVMCGHLLEDTGKSPPLRNIPC
jgi:hypothetical protein